jgi:hypothetical protein
VDDFIVHGLCVGDSSRHGRCLDGRCLHPRRCIGLRTGVGFDVIDLDGEDAVMRSKKSWLPERSTSK